MIAENYKKVLERIKATALRSGRDLKDIMLVTVTKTWPVEVIKEAIKAGARVLGENYVQEALPKIEAIGDKVDWHFIGHLQSNKAKFVANRFKMIESVDSISLAKELNKQAEKQGIDIDILVEVNLAGEESKSGVKPEEVEKLLKEICSFQRIKVKGLMTIPPFFSNPEDSRPYFKRLRELRDELIRLNIPNISLSHLSMGMSNDFEIAIEEGATIVRVGTAIFGERK